MKTYAAQRIGKSGEGEKRVLQLLKEGKVPTELIPDVVSSVSGAWQQAVRTEAASYLPNHKEGKSAKLPTLAEVNVYTGNIENGRVQFSNACASCHMVGKEGIDFGPKLSQIGAKYDKGGLLKSILRPSEGISFGYEGWVLKMKDGSELVGLIVSKTETDIELKLPGGTVQKIKTEAVKTMEQMRASLMPEGLHEAMGMQGLSDLLAFLGSLK
jgi:putative heme-binding domain-containing protein